MKARWLVESRTVCSVNHWASFNMPEVRIVKLQRKSVFSALRL